MFAYVCALKWLFAITCPSCVCVCVCVWCACLRVCERLLRELNKIEAHVKLSRDIVSVVVDAVVGDIVVLVGEIANVDLVRRLVFAHRPQVLGHLRLDVDGLENAKTACSIKLDQDIDRCINWAVKLMISFASQPLQTQTRMFYVYDFPDWFISFRSISCQRMMHRDLIIMSCLSAPLIIIN